MNVLYLAYDTTIYKARLILIEKTMLDILLLVLEKTFEPNVTMSLASWRKVARTILCAACLDKACNAAVEAYDSLLTSLLHCHQSDFDDLEGAEYSSLIKVRLLSTIGCQRCGCPRIHKVTWPFRTRVCQPCLEIFTMSNYRLGLVLESDVMVNLENSLKKFSRNKDLFSRYVGTYTLTFYLISDVDKFLSDSYGATMKEMQQRKIDAAEKARITAKEAMEKKQLAQKVESEERRARDQTCWEAKSYDEKMLEKLQLCTEAARVQIEKMNRYVCNRHVCNIFNESGKSAGEFATLHSPTYAKYACKGLLQFKSSTFTKKWKSKIESEISESEAMRLGVND
jgi:hypothetical protein